MRNIIISIMIVILLSACTKPPKIDIPQVVPKLEEANLVDKKLEVFPGGNYRAGERAGCWWNIYLPFNKIKDKSITIKAIHKESGTEMYELSPTTIQEVGNDYSANLTRVPTEFNIPLPGLWKFDVYIDDSLWESVEIDVPEGSME